MKTAYVFKGHVDSEGTIVLDEPTSLPPGPVLVTVQPIEEQQPSASDYSDAEPAELSKRIAAIAALPGPPPPDDGRTAKDYKQILYGSDGGEGDVQ